HILLQLGLDRLADLRMLDHRHADRVTRYVAEVVATVGEAFRAGSVPVVRGRAGAKRRPRRLEVLLVGLEHPGDLAVRLSEGPRDLDPMAAGACDLERGDAELAERRVAA